MAKVLSFSSNNPKMGGGQKVKGYADGGVVEAPKVDTRDASGKGLVYAKYDTTMEAEAKAPTVGYGQAPKISAMPTVAKPEDITYYGEEHKQAAADLNQQRWDAYNRRAANAAISTGNIVPGAEKPSTVYEQKLQYTAKAPGTMGGPVADTKQAQMKLAADNLVNKLQSLAPQSKLLASASNFIDYAKKRKKDM